MKITFNFSGQEIDEHDVEDIIAATREIRTQIAKGFTSGPLTLPTNAKTGHWSIER